ncbi:hypothetical protein Skr01_27610 [Sphaerisporangium krabiense]|uniref:DUF3071 domain-containing protein n=1 Tax=Sphaerisporangium krabiense TaxID=763782 RepID=A0A7W8ZAH5_9ACTN|nr:septation protein SepH [Sphaerisporangium krabiense]MBB5630371.1 hypothetical protein [Sphaerisporangium krabiense]GII62676.1 hypothetical protein Skr01_27610 [Sphaerisporangium krabiense]
MQELRLVAVSEDGTYLVLATAGRGTRFTLPVDERLRAAVRGNFSRLGQYEIEVESPLRPKEIQARIRAGETAEEIAATAGIPVERVRWFEGPVLQEREYTAQQAQRVAVRLPGESTPGPTLGELVTERLSRRGVPSDEIDWDSCKRDDGLWRIKLGFVWNGHTRNAEWLFDIRRRHVTPYDDEALRLSATEYVEPVEEATVTPFVPRLAAKLAPVPTTGHSTREQTPAFRDEAPFRDERPTFRDDPAPREERPVFRDEPPLREDRPAFREERPAFRDGPSRHDASSAHDEPSFQGHPFRQAPAAYREEPPALRHEPAAFRDERFRDEPSSTVREAPSAYHDASPGHRPSADPRASRDAGEFPHADRPSRPAEQHVGEPRAAEPAPVESRAVETSRGPEFAGAGEERSDARAEHVGVRSEAAEPPAQPTPLRPVAPSATDALPDRDAGAGDVATPEAVARAVRASMTQSDPPPAEEREEREERPEREAAEESRVTRVPVEPVEAQDRPAPVEVRDAASSEAPATTATPEQVTAERTAAPAQATTPEQATPERTTPQVETARTAEARESEHAASERTVSEVESVQADPRGTEATTDHAHDTTSSPQAERPAPAQAERPAPPQAEEPAPAQAERAVPESADVPVTPERSDAQKGSVAPEEAEVAAAQDRAERPVTPSPGTPGPDEAAEVRAPRRPVPRPPIPRSPAGRTGGDTPSEEPRPGKAARPAAPVARPAPVGTPARKAAAKKSEAEDAAVAVPAARNSGEIANRPAAAAAEPDKIEQPDAPGGEAKPKPEPPIPQQAPKPNARPVRKGGRGRRASVPTWDEIMFGARRQD